MLDNNSEDQMRNPIILSPGQTMTPIAIDWQRLALEHIASIRVAIVMMRDESGRAEALGVLNRSIRYHDATTSCAFVITNTNTALDQ